MKQVNNYAVSSIFISLILFIIGSLIYDHYQRGYLFTSRSLNETIFIEQALKRIPKCNSNDYSRQRALLYMLQAWSHLARLYHIRYWIGYKTLAGYIQDHDLSPYDNDIDILIVAEDTSQLIELGKIEYSSIYELKIHSQWFITNHSNRSYLPYKEINFTVQNAKFINIKNNISINIWPSYIYHHNQYKLLFIEYLNLNNWIFSPLEWTFPLEPCVLSGIRVWCPSQPQNFFPSIAKQSCINNSWTILTN